ncbi:MAG: radical SAM protein [Candidatus Omnitrophica bacterium]|nr:radical SAM protein [Candidatus Omnitrophota bacterium]
MVKGNILLVFSDISHYSLHRGYFHYGLASISSFLKEKLGCQVRLFHLKTDIGKSEFTGRIKDFVPDIVAFSSTTNSFPLVKKYAQWVKDYSNEILTVCGGVHAIISPGDILSDPSFDVVIHGDGEYSMSVLSSEWLKNRKIPNAKGIWHKEGDKIIQNGCAVVEDLDLLPFPDWDLFNYGDLSASLQRQGGFMMSRGCPYECSYCCNSAIKKAYRDGNARYVRFKSPQRAISEIKYFIGKFPEIRTLYFDDDILPLNREWFNSFTQLYKQEINMPYWCNVRPNLLNAEIARTLADSGCVRVNIGIESGNEALRNNILRRGLTDRSIESAVRHLKNNKLYIYSFNILGIPHEEKKDLLDTVKINARLDIDKIQATVFYPYPKTELYKLCLSEDLIIPSKWLIEYLGGTILKFKLAQKNRIFFTELMINPLCKIYRKLPVNISENLLKILYSELSSLTLLPVSSIIIRIMLRSKFVAQLSRSIYRKAITPLPARIN